MHTGVLLVSGLYVFLFMALRAISRQFRSRGAGTILIAAVLWVVMAHGAIRFLINGESDFVRFSQSYLLLILVLLGCFSLATLARRVPNFRAAIAVKLVFYVLILSSVAAILRFSPFSHGSFLKPVLFFSESSHFALSFLPFMLYATVTASPRMKLLLIVSSYAIALLLNSVTLVVGIALVTAMVIPLRQLLLLVPIAAIPFLLNFSTVTLHYYSSRLDLFAQDVSSTQNLSALVFLSGWERAYLNLKDTVGLGVGFQQFGIIGSRGDILESIRIMGGRASNLLDGGSVAPKFIGEFGVLGVTILLVYLVNFAKSARWLHEVSMNEVAPRDYRRIFFLSCFVMFSIDLFVRGAGYFSSSVFLFVASLMWLSVRERSDKAPNRDGHYIKKSPPRQQSRHR